MLVIVVKMGCCVPQTAVLSCVIQFSVCMVTERAVRSENKKTAAYIVNQITVDAAFAMRRIQTAVSELVVDSA